MRTFFKIASFGRTFLLMAGLHGSSALALDREVILESGAMDLPFGSPVDLRFRLTNWFEGRVSWSQIANKLPPGLTLKAAATDEAQVTGVVQFAGRWCFSLAAHVSGQPTGSGTFCMQSLDNPAKKYPKLADDDVFIILHRWKYEVAFIALDPLSIANASGEKVLSAQIVDGGLPDGIHMTVDVAHDRLVFSGTALRFAPHSVTLRLTNGDGESSYVVLSNIVTLDTSCKEGYTYDYRLNLCVVDEGRSCPTGYIYNSETKRCELYQRQCPRGYYYDFATDTCKLLERPRR